MKPFSLFALSSLALVVVAAFPIGGCGPSCNGTVCSTDQFCAFVPCDIETGESHYACIQRPTSCHDRGGTPVCAADGNVYESDCEASKAGYDTNRDDVAGCATPTGMFACGAYFCREGREYCYFPFTDCDSSQPPECVPLPNACTAAGADCSCLEGPGCSHCTEQRGRFFCNE